MIAATSAVSRFPLTRAQWVTVSLMIALSCLSYFNRTIMSIAGPTVMKEFSISPADMGTVYSAFLLSYTILMSAGGWIADRFGQRAVLAVTGFGAARLTGLTSICGNPGLGALLGVLPAFLLHGGYHANQVRCSLRRGFDETTHLVGLPMSGN